jgi:hypothetical protein
MPCVTGDLIVRLFRAAQWVLSFVLFTAHDTLPQTISCCRQRMAHSAAAVHACTVSVMALGVFVTREHDRHNKSGITGRVVFHRGVSKPSSMPSIGALMSAHYQWQRQHMVLLHISYRVWFGVNLRACQQMCPALSWTRAAAATVVCMCHVFHTIARTAEAPLQQTLPFGAPSVLLACAHGLVRARVWGVCGDSLCLRPLVMAIALQHLLPDLGTEPRSSPQTGG